MAQQITTLLATLFGALLGFAAPLISGALTRRDKNRDTQQAVAARIFDLFDTPKTLPELLLAPDSIERRKLYILALQLRSPSARDACMRLISTGGDPSGRDEKLHDAWYLMMNEIGAIYRNERERGGGNHVAR